MARYPNQKEMQRVRRIVATCGEDVPLARIYGEARMSPTKTRKAIDLLTYQGWTVRSGRLWRVGE